MKFIDLNDIARQVYNHIIERGRYVPLIDCRYAVVASIEALADIDQQALLTTIEKYRLKKLRRQQKEGNNNGKP